MEKPRVLVTGASGFTGHYICALLEEHGFAIFYLTEDGSRHGKKIDISSYDQVKTCISKIKPGFVIHLAAISFVAHERKNDFYRVNVEGTLNLLQALEEVKCIKGKVILASSANIYGNSYQNIAIDESFAPNPVNDYAVSKLSMELMANLHKRDLPIDIVRPFNYTGVGQSSAFLIPKIISAFKNKENVIELGNLDVYRDFSDVRNIAEYYLKLLMNKDYGATYNLCSGKLVSIHDIIEICQEQTKHKIEIKSVKRFKRENELKSLLGSNEKLHSKIDVSRLISIDETIDWMIKS